MHSDDTPTTSYKSKTDNDLPPIQNESPSQFSPKSSRRRNRSSPSIASLLPEGENTANNTHSNDRVGQFNENGKRATITAMICRKSKAFLFGQMLSLFLAATGAVQSALYLDCGLSAPTFSMLSFYLPLCIICTIRLYRQSKVDTSGQSTQNSDSSNGNELHLDAENNTDVVTSEADGNDEKFHKSQDSQKKHGSFTLCRIIPLQSPPWKYATVAIADVYANYTTILAFKYAPITTVSLFDALAIPSAMLISRLCFGRKYTKIHLLAVAVCCIGISINVFQDYRENLRLEKSGGAGETAQEEFVEEEYPYKLAGDALAITGGILFGVSNTLAEVAVREWGTQDEFLSAMTLIASIITFLQTLIVERQEVRAFFGNTGDDDSCSELGSLALLAIFAIASVVNYIGIASFLGVSDAAFLNLSLLTGDAWAVAFSVFAEGIVPPSTFYVALVITVSGVFIYETAPSPVSEDTQQQQQDEVIGEDGIEMGSNSTGHVLV